MKRDIESLAKVHVAPGDVIVLRIAIEWPEPEFKELMARMKEFFPDNKTMVLGPNIDLQVFSSAAPA